MRVLAIDAALGPCSAALVEDGVVLAERHSADPRGASSILPALVAAVLAEADCGFDSVAVTVGPGSFTGIRAALALAHGLAIGAGAPILGVTTVATVIAACTKLPGMALWVAIDTRRGRVFLGRDGVIAAVEIAGLRGSAEPVAIAGDAAVAVAAQIGGAVVGTGAIAARDVARAAADPANHRPAQPLYIEPPEARPAAALRAPPA